MSSTFDPAANIIAETCGIGRETITPESHAIEDLGIDSRDFLDDATPVCGAEIAFRLMVHPNAEFRGQTDALAARIEFPMKALGHG